MEVWAPPACFGRIDWQGRCPPPHGWLCAAAEPCLASPSQQARIELKVKAVGGNTIPRLRERLEPTGFFVHPDPVVDDGDKCVARWGEL